MAFLATATVTQAQTCTIPMSGDGRIDAAELSDALAACAAAPDTDVWAEVIDFGSYDVLTDADGERAVGFKHAGWDREIALAPGLIFGFRFVLGADTDQERLPVTIVTTPPSGSGLQPQRSDQSALTNSPVPALFLIGDPKFEMPGLWQIDLRFGGQIVARQHFFLTDPQ